jgi:hypothetical protein
MVRSGEVGRSAGEAGHLGDQDVLRQVGRHHAFLDAVVVGLGSGSGITTGGSIGATTGGGTGTSVGVQIAVGVDVGVRAGGCLSTG